MAIRVAEGTAAEVIERVAKQGLLAGYDLARSFPERKNQLLVAVTEKHTRNDLDGFLAALAGKSVAANG